MDKVEKVARAKAKEIVAAIQDACDIAHGAATAWCPDEAENLIEAALAAMGEREPVAEATDAMEQAAFDADLDICWSYRSDGRPGGPKDVWRVMATAIRAGEGSS